jgi:NAD(P)-dependent dehydrogenase (short-subunit alcohol dehydrogenase family)
MRDSGFVNVLTITMNRALSEGPLTGQVAIVTGGGRGIGRAVALELARAGAAVAVLARSAMEIEDTARLVASEGGRAVAVAVDVTDAAAVDAAVERVRQELGDADLLVNNAGRNSVFGPLWQANPAQWWNDVTVNLLGPFTCSAAVLPAMVERRSGRIVNVVSGTAGRPFPHNSAYAASKAALVRLTDCLAAETTEHGVQVFALGPGTVRTQISAGLQRSADGRRWLADVIDRLTFIPPEVAARAVVYLASGQGDALSGRWVDSTDDLADVAGRAAEVCERDLFQLRRSKF